MGRTDRSKEGTRINPNEGTSARTRAFSFEDIILRRKKKQSSNTNEKDSKTEESFEVSNNTLDHASPDRHEITRTSYVSVKESCKKEESTSRKERNIMKRRHTGAHDMEVGVKVKSSHRKSGRDKESTKEKHSRHLSKTDDFPALSEKPSGRKRLEDFEENDKYGEHYRKSKRGKKDGHNDDNSRARSSKKSNKHDFAKLHDTMYSERNGHKDYHVEHFYEDPRLRKKRSRSQEYDPERGRSASLSPLSHKHAFHVQDYEESYMDNSRKKHSDGDRYKPSGNGGYSGGHHRKHGSGLGGYSPRKRKTEAAVKTPSPTVRSPERKVATWDQLPSVTNITNTGSSFVSFPLAASKIIEAASFAATLSTAKTYPVTSINSASVVMSASLESVQLTQATRPLRRLYIENLPPSASEKSVIDCFNDLLVSPSANHPQTKPCISCIINKDKAHALVEFLTPEDATAALAFDGNSFFGSMLKMRRPKDFVEAATGVTGVPEKTPDVARIVSDVVIDSPYKIFVGGISDLLSSKMLMDIASAFGPLKAYHFDFSKDINGLCAFLEYEDHSITSKACAGLDGLMLGGCILTAVSAFPDVNGKEDDSTPPSYAVPLHAKPLLANVSQVLQLRNVVNPEDLPILPESELEETLEDIRLECARFGTIKAVHLVRYSSNDPKSEVSELSDSVNPPARLKLNTHSHPCGTETVGEMNKEDSREASNSNGAIVIKKDEIQETAAPVEVPEHTEDATNAQTEGNYHEDNNAVFISSAPQEIQDAELAEDANLDPVALNKDEDGGNEERKLVEQRDLKGSGEQLQAHVSDAFVPGSVLVEFQRKEAACSAAHCLHGRSYGELTVEVKYIPYDLYFKRFPK